ncbi:MAG: hypothetical protein KJN68_11205, partial [Bacteroidia bacterium]|nr:hypothetical protein [Bacteroidia bacterium]
MRRNYLTILLSLILVQFSLSQQAPGSVSNPSVEMSSVVASDDVRNVTITGKVIEKDTKQP